MPPRQRALALSGAGFIHLAGGDQARARRLFKQSMPLYRQAGDRLGIGLTAAALGHLLASSQRGSAYAGDLLEQTLIQLRAMAGEELTGPERVQHQLDVALASNFLGQIQARPGRSSPRGGALRRRPDRGPRRGRPVHHPGLPLRPGPEPPGPRRDLPSATDLLGQGLFAGGRGRGRARPGLLSRGASRPSPSGRTSRSAPPACSPRPTHCLRPRAAAGCTPTCLEPRTTATSWPGSAPAPPTRRSSKPGRTAAPLTSASAVRYALKKDFP